MGGAKLDPKKCFDSVAPLQATRCWDRLGALGQVVPILQDSYQEQQRCVECEGVVFFVIQVDVVIAPGLSSQHRFAGRTHDSLDLDGSGQERFRSYKWVLRT